MNEAVLVTGLFINSGLVVSRSSFFTIPQFYYDSDPAFHGKGP